MHSRQAIYLIDSGRTGLRKTYNSIHLHWQDMVGCCVVDVSIVIRIAGVIPQLHIKRTNLVAGNECILHG